MFKVLSFLLGVAAIGGVVWIFMIATIPVAKKLGVFKKEEK